MSTETIAQPKTVLTATRNSLRQVHALQDEAGRRSACLRVGCTVRRAEIRTEDGSWPVRRHGWRQVTAGDSPAARAPGAAAALVPGTELDVGWVITRNRRAYQGTLTRDGQTMLRRMPALSGRQSSATVLDFPVRKVSADFPTRKG